jgi:PPM family protein phosphatase
MSEEYVPNLTYAGLTDIGSVRDNNEDSWSADEAFGCYIVSDGMGGALAGEVASHMVVEDLPKALKTHLPEKIDDIGSEEVRTQVFKALSEVNDAVCKRSAEDPQCTGMGATVVMVLIRESHAMVVHAGDSRAYLLRNGALSLMTKDHNMLQVLIDEGVVAPEDAFGHPAGCELLCDVGMPEGMFADVLYLDLEKDDKLLLCSDGLNGMIYDEQIKHIISKDLPLDDICEELVAAANEAGGHDNVTSLIIKCD